MIFCTKKKITYLKFAILKTIHLKDVNKGKDLDLKPVDINFMTTLTFLTSL